MSRTSRGLRELVRIRALTLAVVVLCAAAPVGAAAGDGCSVTLVVTWRGGVASTMALESAIPGRGAIVRETILGGRATLIEVDADLVADIQACLGALPGVEAVEPECTVHIAWEPNDPYYTSGDQWAYSRIQGPAAWDVEQGDEGVLVAVVDTGADLGHPDLAGRLDTTSDRNFTVDSGDPAYNIAADDHGHGTHVSGIVAAVSNNGIGVAGTAPQVRVLPLKALLADGTGSSTDLAEAIYYAADAGADVINLSVSFGPGQRSLLVEDAIRYAHAAGAVVVGASGNAYTPIVCYPAATPECIAVGATVPSDERAEYSSYGTALDLVAPGGIARWDGDEVILDDMVLSTLPVSEGSYGYMIGTSMATPFVSAAAALLRSAQPAATPDQIRSALELSARDVGSAGIDNETGHGLLQLRNALECLAGTDTEAPVTTSDAVATYDDTATVLLSADDGTGLGVAATYYSVDRGALQRGSEAIVAGYGSHELAFYSDDVVGNRETTNTAALYIGDTQPPITGSDAVAAYDSTATITLLPDDGDGSGVDSTWYSLDGADPTTGTVVVTPVEGAHNLVFWSEDVAGNVESPACDVEFTVYGVPVVSRVAGPTRYNTALQLAYNTYPEGSADVVVLASGQKYPDALAASALAGVLDAPLLLTLRDVLPAGLLGELDRLGCTRVIVVGGTGAVSTAVEQVLVLHGTTVERVYGADRFATAAEVARRVAEETSPESVPVAFVVRADTFPDALAVSSLAASRGFPVLLTSSAQLSPVTRQALIDLGVSEVMIAGGTGAVSKDVAEQIESLPGVTVVRKAGADRYSTGVTVAKYGIERGWVGEGFFGVATGATFPDGLTGGVVAAAHNGTVLLTAPTELSAPTESSLSALGTDGVPIWVYGGTGAVSEDTLSALAELRF